LNLVDAAKAANVSRFVLISFPPVDAEFPLQAAKRRVEEHLKSGGLTYAILQPTFFMEVWLSPALGFDAANAKAQIYGSGENKISWISYKDVAKFAVASIDNPEARNAVIELGGPEALSPLEVVRAFEELLKEHPEWRGKVTHVALLYPSRRALWEYRAYEAEVLDNCDRINSDLGSDDWQPIVVINEDNYPRALASLTRYDVLLVNPITDGMNLVSKEGPAVNRTDGVLVLSRNAGSWYELGHAALTVNPFDVSEMAEAIHTGLTMEPQDRATRAELLAEVVERNSPWKWLSHQLEDISPYLSRAPARS